MAEKFYMSLEDTKGITNTAFQLQENGTTHKEDSLGGFRSPNSSPFLSVSHHPQQNREESSIKSTRDVLPRLENYRNSKRGVKRPSMGELHGEDVVTKDPNAGADQPDIKGPRHEGIKLGWVQGVLIPCLLNIFGVMLFLRLSWVVAEAGIGQSLLIVGISAAVCIITTLSLSAISTNGEVKGGGIYYIISRSLGPEFGASVGVVFAFANAVSASMNTIGFCNSLSELLGKYGLKIIDGAINDARVIGLVAIMIMVIICAVGMEWESKAQNFLIAAIVIAMIDFIAGTILGPRTDEDRAKGFMGFNTTTFVSNWGSDYRPAEGVTYDFFQVFAIFFPSVTGIQAGANISGDLKDPGGAIPKGTLLALLISMISYIVFVLFAGAAAIRDASGNVTDLLEGDLADCAPNCQYGLFNNYQMMEYMSAWGPLIYVGCWAATLSTALTNLLSVPRLIQALGMDRIYPGLIFFSRGYGKNGEPYRGYVLTFLVSGCFLLIGDLNAVAPLISNFYLASYALINFCTFHAALIKPLGWRPTFKYYNTWLSLTGFILCVIIMFLVNWWSSLITFIVILGLYLVVVYRKPDVNWGSSTQAQTYKTALVTAHRLINIGEHVKNYKPQILVLCGCPSARPALVDFANLITKNNSLLILGDVMKDRMQHRERSAKVSEVYSWLKINKTKGFYSLLDNVDFETGAKALLKTSGIGRLSPNVLMMGYKNNWRTCSSEELVSYFNILHAAFDQRFSVTLLRLRDGLDNRKLVDQGKTTHEDVLSHDLHSATDPTGLGDGKIMHADSNLSLDQTGRFTENGNRPSSTGSATNSITAQGKTSHNLMRMLKRNNFDSVVNGSGHQESSTEMQLDIPEYVIDGIDTMAIFRNKQNTGNIDVWWLYDDGGLTMLLPHIISTRQNWARCSLRVFALGTINANLETERKNMESLLSKFRLKYSSLEIVSISDKPQEETIQFFDDLIKDFRTPEDTAEYDCKITEAEIAALQDKTFRQLRLRELLLEHSKDANLIVMSLPMPRRGQLSAPLYMAWLETLTKDLPPYLLVRGNQQSVLTFYS